MALEAEDHRAENPCAQLIHQASISTSNRTITVKQMNQWFCENTEKDSSQGKGWMGTVLYHLSTNPVSFSALLFDHN